MENNNPLSPADYREFFENVNRTLVEDRFQVRRSGTDLVILSWSDEQQVYLVACSGPAEVLEPEAVRLAASAVKAARV